MALGVHTIVHNVDGSYQVLQLQRMTEAAAISEECMKPIEWACIEPPIRIYCVNPTLAHQKPALLSFSNPDHLEPGTRSSTHCYSILSDRPRSEFALVHPPIGRNGNSMAIHIFKGTCSVKNSRDSQPCPQDLHDLMKSSKKVGIDYIVVDVRDDDYAGGHIKGCLRAPFQKYEAGVSHLVSKLKGVPTVVFHCMFSQVR